MAYVIADNIISPLGQTSGETYLAVKAGKSQLRVYPRGVTAYLKDSPLR